MITKWRLICRLLLLLLNTILVTEAKNKYNVSLGQMATCKEYDLHGTGYSYTDFFYVHSMDNNKMAPDERLHLKFYVMTSMDAHILLAVNGRPRLLDRVYEIVIGAGSNTFSTIRTSMGRRRVVTNAEPKLLSIFDPTPIEIVQMKDGDLLVYIPGFKAEPLLNFTDASPLNINYVSFSTFGSISAKWFYDCQFDGFETEIEQEVRLLSPPERLIENITANADNGSIPMDLKEVNFAFHIHSVAYKQELSILKTRMDLILYWEDSRLQWDPQDFYGIDTIARPKFDIWTPKLVVLNGALETLRESELRYEIKLQANGTISLIARNVELNTWCVNSAHNWPRDQLGCELTLGLNELDASADAQLQLAYDTSRPLSHEPVSMLSEWQFVELSVTSIDIAYRERFTETGIMQILNGDVVIEFKIVRNSDFYRNVFIMPFLACQTLILLSFLLRGYRRGALILVVVVVISLGLMFITRHAPQSYVPDILIAYQHILRIATFCYLLHVAIIWLETYPPKYKPNAWMMTLVNASILRLLLCMRFSDSSEYVDIQEHPWREVAKMLNNFSFIAINLCLIATDVFLLPNV